MKSQWQLYDYPFHENIKLHLGRIFRLFNDSETPPFNFYHTIYYIRKNFELENSVKFKTLKLPNQDQ